MMARRMGMRSFIINNPSRRIMLELAVRSRYWIELLLNPLARGQLDEVTTKRYLALIYHAQEIERCRKMASGKLTIKKMTSKVWMHFNSIFFIINMFMMEPPKPLERRKQLIA